MYFNKAIIAGNLTRDPELKALPTGSKVTSFAIATNRFWKDQSGQKQQATDYHNIVVFGAQAETCNQYLKKGSQVLVEGRLQTRSWDGTDGKKQYRTEIVADRVQFGSKSDNSSPAGNYQKNPSSNQTQNQNDDTSDDDGGSIDYPEDDINPEDIPF